MSGEGRILHRRTRGLAIALGAIAAVAIVACGSDEPDTAATATALATASEEARASASPTSVPISTPTVTATVAATSEPEPTATTAATAAPTEAPVEGYSSNSAMHSLISDLSRQSFYDSSSVDGAACGDQGERGCFPWFR